MLRRFVFGATSLTVLAFWTAALAQQSQYGTPAEAKAMLEKAVDVLKADKARALATFSKGEGGFKDRDLYVACADADGKVSAHIDALRIGMNRNAMKDASGKPYGEEIAKVAAEGKIAEVGYLFPRPGEDKTPVQKVAFVTKVDDQTCLVGYYK